MSARLPTASNVVSRLGFRLAPRLYFDDASNKHTRTRQDGGYGLNLDPEQIIPSE